MNAFVLDLQMPRVRFGAGALAHLRDEIAALVLTPGQAASAERVAAMLGAIRALLQRAYDGAPPQP